MEGIINITCTVERVRFFNKGWWIIEASVNQVKEGNVSKNEFILLKGVMPEPRVGNMYNIVAEYVVDPKWGGQYNLISIYTALEFGEGDAAGQKKFLSSIFTPLQVQNMYEALENPFETLKNENAAELLKVKTCGFKTARLWIDRFRDNYKMARIFVELEDFKLTNAMVNKLVNRYISPDIVIEKVKNNPYVLVTEVDGIGWATADEMALRGGLELYGKERVGAYIQYYLDNRGKSGGSWITCDELLGALIEDLGEEIPDVAITEAIHDIEDVLWWNDDKTKIGLKKYYNIEQKIAEELIRLRNAESNIAYGDFEDITEHVEHRQGWKFTEEQKLGAKVGLENNITIITGSGGTGKTSLVRLILDVLKHCSFVQCALSGRASSRMQEVTGQEGYTIHRLLGYPNNKDKTGYTYHKENPLPYDIYIVDEISMIDSFLFYNLLRAIPDGAKLYLLGDPGQLEAVGSGNIAHDMIHSGEIPVVTLTKIHRQAARSAIITESIKVRNSHQLVEKDWVGVETRGELQDLTIECFSDRSNTYYSILRAFQNEASLPGFNIMDTQIIVPMKNRGNACTYELNNALQELYNPADPKKEEEFIETGGQRFIRVGDKVINTKNNYKTNPSIYNGNIGIVKGFDWVDTYDSKGDPTSEYSMLIDFLGIGEVWVPKGSWASIELAYAITVHKSQGSEFENVIFGVDYSSFALLTRELVYTGITRAKSRCRIIAETNALRKAVATAAISNKQTHLQGCLYDVAHPKLIF